MYEILFRGKRVDNGEWVEGYYYKAKFYRDDTELCDYITIPHPSENGRGNEHFMVLPETVGQYTGLTDKNGKRIFEGDIVIDKYSRETFGFVGVVIYNPTSTQFQIYNDKQPGYVVNLGSRIQSVRVLGNIHDDSELLKGGE